MNEAEYYRALAAIRGRLEEADRRRFDTAFTSSHERSAVVTYGLGYFLGSLGVDRFRLGHWGRGLGKLAITIITLTYLGWIWQIIDLFLVGGDTRRSNLERAEALVAVMTGQAAPSRPSDEF
ncbi:MAG: TM2 domain-containing protein [Maricaulaceae bacterium]